MDKVDSQPASNLRKMMAHYLRGTVPEDLIEKYTTKEFLLKDQDRMLKEIKTHEVAYANSATLVSEPDMVFPNVSRVNLLTENRVRILDLMRSIDKPIAGKFFLCRTISPPLKIAAVVVVVEDPEAEFAARFSMYNLFPSNSRKKIIELLPVGTIMAIRNPFFKTMTDGGYGLRTDNPGDVMFLNECQCEEIFPTYTWKGEIPHMYKDLKSTPKSAEEWKILGNNYFSKKNYVGALNAYTTGLKKDPKSVCLLSNRSATHLQMLAYRSALNDANDVLKIEPSHVKATYRKIKALTGLKRYKEALEFVDNVQSSTFKEKDQKELEKLKSKIKAYIHQTQTGDYDISFMLITAMDNPSYSFDYADYVGPLEERNAPGKGRGLFATENVKPGQLLIGAKAFALNVPEVESKVTYLTISTIKMSVTKREDDALPLIVARILTMAPEKGEELYKLYAGPEMSFLHPEDSEHINLVDNKRIQKICSFNSFEARENQLIDRSYEGIWLLPSLINHSCYDCNCNWFVFGDFILIRAFKPIAKREEILISYVQPALPFPQRMEFFEKYRFLCDCQMCELEQKESKKTHQKREQWIGDFVGVFEFAGGIIEDVAVVKYYVNRITSLRPKNQHMNLYLVGIFLALSITYANKKQFTRAAEILEKMYEICQDTIMGDMQMKAVANIVSYYLQDGETDKAKMWVQELRDLILRVCGTLSIAEFLEPIATVRQRMLNNGLSL